MASSSAIDNSYKNAIGDALNSSTGGKEMDKEAFLQLLVTQFKYQDPLNPMEDKEFVAQLAQFSALEQSMTMNKNIEKLYTLQGLQTQIGAANYIGRDVSARGFGVSVSDKGKTISSLQYAISEEMSTGFVNVLDSTGNTVATLTLGAKAAGIHDLPWDGYQSNGNKAPDGVYTMAFVTYNANGDRMLVDASVGGRVDAVSTYNGEQYLRLTDGRVVLLSNVREIVQPKQVTDKPEDPDKDDEDKDPPTVTPHTASTGENGAPAAAPASAPTAEGAAPASAPTKEETEAAMAKAMADYEKAVAAWNNWQDKSAA